MQMNGVGYIGGANFFKCIITIDQSETTKSHICLEMQWLCIYIFAGKVLRQRQCTLEGGAWYLNVWGSVHWECKFL